MIIVQLQSALDNDDIGKVCKLLLRAQKTLPPEQLAELINNPHGNYLPFIIQVIDKLISCSARWNFIISMMINMGADTDRIYGNSGEPLHVVILRRLAPNNRDAFSSLFPKITIERSYPDKLSSSEQENEFWARCYIMELFGNPPINVNQTKDFYQAKLKEIKQVLQLDTPKDILWYAAEQGLHLILLHVLEKRTPHPQLQVADICAAICLAVTNRHREAVRVLINYVAAKDIENYRHYIEQYSAIDIAELAGDYDIQMILLNKFYGETFNNNENEILARDQLGSMQQRRKKLEMREDIYEIIKPQLPIGYFPGVALSDGDCLFDSIAQFLNRSRRESHNSAKSLRVICKEYVANEKNAWVRESIDKDDKNSGGHVAYLRKVEFTSQEIEQTKMTDPAVWGRPEIEGRILCDVFKIKLYVIDIQPKPIDGIQFTEYLIDKDGCKIVALSVQELTAESTLCLINYNLHFVPALKVENKPSIELNSPAQQNSGFTEVNIKANFLLNFVVTHGFYKMAQNLIRHIKGFDKLIQDAFNMAFKERKMDAIFFLAAFNYDKISAEHAPALFICALMQCQKIRDMQSLKRVFYLLNQYNQLINVNNYYSSNFKRYKVRAMMALKSRALLIASQLTGCTEEEYKLLTYIFEPEPISPAPDIIDQYFFLEGGLYLKEIKKTSSQPNNNNSGAVVSTVAVGVSANLAVPILIDEKLLVSQYVDSSNSMNQTIMEDVIKAIKENRLKDALGIFKSHLVYYAFIYLDSSGKTPWDYIEGLLQNDYVFFVVDFLQMFNDQYYYRIFSDEKFPEEKLTKFESILPIAVTLGLNKMVRYLVQSRIKIPLGEIDYAFNYAVMYQYYDIVPILLSDIETINVIKNNPKLVALVLPFLEKSLILIENYFDFLNLYDDLINKYIKLFPFNPADPVLQPILASPKAAASSSAVKVVRKPSYQKEQIEEFKAKWSKLLDQFCERVIYKKGRLQQQEGAKSLKANRLESLLNIKDVLKQRIGICFDTRSADDRRVTTNHLSHT